MKNVISETKNFNPTCAICMEDGETKESGKLYPLVCTHRFHIVCLSGMTKLECPLCREPAINLPKTVKNKISENARTYREEMTEQEEREFRQMMENENNDAVMLHPVRLPPHVELILALKYVFQLGIPVSLIPIETVLEIDPQSPLPEPGSIFQNTVKHLLSTIQQRSLSPVEEDDGQLSDDGEDPKDLAVPRDRMDPDDEIILDNEENPFEFEGENLQIVHRVRTIPARVTANLNTARLFSTASFQIANLPDLTQEDLLNLRMGHLDGQI